MDTESAVLWTRERMSTLDVSDARLRPFPNKKLWKGILTTNVLSVRAMIDFP